MTVFVSFESQWLFFLVLLSQLRSLMKCWIEVVILCILHVGGPDFKRNDIATLVGFLFLFLFLMSFIMLGKFPSLNSLLGFLNLKFSSTVFKDRLCILKLSYDFSPLFCHWEELHYWTFKLWNQVCISGRNWFWSKCMIYFLFFVFLHCWTWIANMLLKMFSPLFLEILKSISSVVISEIAGCISNLKSEVEQYLYLPPN